VSALAFELPAGLEAHEPPEARGLTRDGVRLMVAEREDGRISHARFGDLPQLLDPGDLLVVNDSATLPAAIDARRANGSRIRVHFSTRAPELDDSWRVIELRSRDGGTPIPGVPGEHLELAGGAALQVAAPYGETTRLMLARWHAPVGVEAHLDRYGQPIRYGYAEPTWPLEAYQNVYALNPGSSEMPSAGRPLSIELIVALATRGILIAPITLHCGVSSPERHELPYPEPYAVPESTARLVAATHEWGGRVIAVGTTVVRALETAAVSGGAVVPSSGWTDLVITPERPLYAVDGMITGWHEPEASHLLMLEAVAGSELLARSYEEALEHGYLWHEFGDSHLILP
jgi:S-adenosylmethionine:tRNA ribosyltransferase-isomerase